MDECTVDKHVSGGFTVILDHCALRAEMASGEKGEEGAKSGEEATERGDKGEQRTMINSHDHHCYICINQHASCILQDWKRVCINHDLALDRFAIQHRI
jgi:hypothetical protein